MSDTLGKTIPRSLPPTRAISLAALFVAAALLAACGGGGSSTVSTPTVTVQGSLPGSTFVAVDNGTNAEAGRAAAAGTPATFDLAVPVGHAYRFYVLENPGTGFERVYPMYRGTNNVFSFDNSAAGRIVQLGMVSPDFVTGRFLPSAAPSPMMVAMGESGALPASLAGSAFLRTGLDNSTWGYHSLFAGGASGTAWEYGTMTFGPSTGAMTGIVRNGTAQPSRNSIAWALSLSGMMADPGDATFQGAFSRDDVTMASTRTDGSFGPALTVALKTGPGTMYSTNGTDLTGTWNFQRLAAGADNASSGWAYGMVQFAGGTGSTLSPVTNTGGSFTRAFSLAESSAGTLRDTLDNTFHGTLAADMETIVATDNAGGVPEMWILTRASTSTPTAVASDMGGDWVMHSLSAGNSAARGWTYGHSAVNGATGVDSFSSMAGFVGGTSVTVPAATMTFSMTNGSMSMTGGTGGGMMGGGGMGGGMMGGGVTANSFHGFLNDGRNLMLSTYTDNTGGGFPFSIQLK